MIHYHFVLRITAVTAFALTSLSSHALTWTANTATPGIGKRNNSVVSSGQYIYSLGGRPDDDGTTPNAGDDVYRGTIDNTGVIAWATQNSLPGKRTEGGAAISGDKIYYWGGWDTDFPTRPTCYYAPLSGGTIGSWVTSTVILPNAPNNEPLADSFGRNNLVFNGTLYTINGEDNSAGHPEVAYYSKLTGTGDYGTWTSTNEPGDVSTWWHGMAVFQGTTANYIYKLGGGPLVNAYGDAQNTVFRAVINADGSLGTWSQLSATIPAANGIMDFACIQSGNQIYIIGGSDNGGAAQNTVYIGTIDPANGDIAWVTDNDTLPETRVRVSGNLLTAPNGTRYLAVVGGAAATGTSPGLTTVYTAIVSPPASVDDWHIY